MTGPEAVSRVVKEEWGGCGELMGCGCVCIRPPDHPESHDHCQTHGVVVARIPRSDRGFVSYGEPVRTAYGELVEVYQSSAASAPHCWLQIHDDGQTRITTQSGGDMKAHLNTEQAIAIRDRLDAWILDQGEPN